MSPRNLNLTLIVGFVLANAFIDVTAAEFELRINEFMAINATGLEDKHQDRPDWIELYHGGEEPISLAGWSLTDDPEDLRKWPFPHHFRIAPKSHALVFASGKDGNTLFSQEFHTNFSLAGSGGYIALVGPDGQMEDEIPQYPSQSRDVAYGLVEDAGPFDFLLEGTPRKANTGIANGNVAQVQFSVPRGVYHHPLTLELSTETPGATIRFSTSGAAPSLFTATNYTGPIEISTTTTIRAIASAAGLRSTPIATHTFLFPAEVVSQSKMRTRITEDVTVRDALLEGLSDIDSVAIITEKRSTQISASREEPMSMELLTIDGTEGFQINAGIKRVGGASVNHPKNNMRLYFSSEYGKGKLKYPLYEGHAYTNESAREFDRLQLHGGSHDSVFHLRNRALYLRNRWMNDAQFAMGQLSLRGKWVHVYLDGTYWGVYQLMERPHPAYFEAYMGGNDSDYMATNRGSPVGSSDMKSWRAMVSENDYSEFQRWTDVPSFIDYMLVNLYAANEDWNPKHNWMGGGPVTPGRGGFKFFSWDSDITFQAPTINLVTSPGPENLFSKWKRHPDFKALLADRVHKHLYKQGALTPERAAARMNFRANEIDRAIIAESARWGTSGWSKSTWEKELERLNEAYFPERTRTLVNQLTKAKLFNPGILPRFDPPGGVVPDGSMLALRKSLFARATIYYTTDGSDPRLAGGRISSTAHAYTKPFPLTQSQKVRMRSHNDMEKDVPWSALIEAEFLVGVTRATGDHLVISKIDYRPAKPSQTELNMGFFDRSDFEFLELTNKSAERLSLKHLAFVEGIQFDFGDDSVAKITALEPAERVLVVRNPEAFALRYGHGLPVAGVFEGRLDNDGERVRLKDDLGNTVVVLSYDEALPWPEEANGKGSYLVFQAGAVNAIANDPSQWRSSTEDDRPGDNIVEHDGLTYLTWRELNFEDAAAADRMADPDQDGLVNLIEYALGTDPNSSASTAEVTVDAQGADVIYQFQHRSDLSDEVLLNLEFSDDLVQWDSDALLTELPRQAGPLAGLELVSFGVSTATPNPRQRFARLRVTMSPR